MGVVRRHSLSYNWRLFVPVVAILWALIMGLSAWQVTREQQFRREFVDSQLQLVNNRVVDAIDGGKWGAMRRFLVFAGKYYRKNELFTDIRVTIFDSGWRPVFNEGPTLVFSPAQRHEATTDAQINQVHQANIDGNDYFYVVQRTQSHNYYVVAALPNDNALSDFINAGRDRVWLTVAAVGVILTLFLWWTTRYLTKNVRLLREFAERTASDPAFIPAEDFPRGEIGDIARQIVAIYNERAEAQRRVEREHAIAMHAIEEKAFQKRQLTNNINHELKTPIGVIKGYLDTLADSDNMDENIRTHFITKARDHANRLAELINDVSAVTRLQDGAMMINTSSIDYHELAYTFANDVSESGILGSMHFEYDIPIGTFVVGNSNLLQAMLMNLAKNAANYSGGTLCRLVCNGTVDDGDSFSFSFYDDGSGVPDDTLPHLFDRFYRVDSGRARKSGGTGLGLAIVEQTISAHKGTIIGLNRPDGGLEIRFTLPRGRKHF